MSELNGKWCTNNFFRLKRLTVLLFLLVLYQQFFNQQICPTAHAHSTDDAECKIVEQQHSLVGQVRTVIARDALRIDLLWSKTYLIAKAPDWRVVFYNPTNKSAMDMPLKEYLADDPNWQGSNRFRDLSGNKMKSVEAPLNELGKIRYAENDCLKFGILKLVGNRVDPRDRYQVYFYTLPDASIRPEISQILYHFYSIRNDSNRGIPVYSAPAHPTKSASLQHDIGFLANLTSSDMGPRVTTSKISKGAFPSSYFDYPKTYKKVSYELDVLSDPNRQGAAEDMIREMRFGEAPSSNAKKSR
ncbi:MAG TPA: hypothetical protein V6C86_05585 [Oculatellaceae cyanobacterium]